MIVKNVAGVDFYFLEDHKLTLSVFPVVVETNDTLLYSKIYPIKQRDIQKLLEIAKKIPELKKITLFGSAITDRCHWDSDLDIAVDIDYTSKDDYYRCVAPLYYIDSDIDILDTKEIQTEMINRDVMKGLTIYERLS